MDQWKLYSDLSIIILFSKFRLLYCLKTKIGDIKIRSKTDGCYLHQLNSTLQIYDLFLPGILIKLLFID